MYLIVGLGNPGYEYNYTRHNVGFLVVDKLATSFHCEFHPGKGNYWLATCSLQNHDVTILKPMTFMNNSGIAVKEYCETYSIAYQNMLVVSDDFQLPLGTIRIRPSGSDGGHHGIASIIYQLETDQFPRLRCGIGSTEILQEQGTMNEFVLEQFPESEVAEVNHMTDRAKEACVSFISNGIEQTMNQFNTKPKEEIS